MLSQAGKTGRLRRQGKNQDDVRTYVLTLEGWTRAA
jgi:hypothetical protein